MEKFGHEEITVNKIVDLDKLVDDRFDKLMKSSKNYIACNSSLEQIQKAFLFAKEKHAGHVRHSGEPYITHPIAVAQILTEFKVDVASIVAALLHDVIEDTDTDAMEIEHHFGSVVAGLVEGLTKIGQIKFRTSQEKIAENFRKMVLAIAKDLRVILVKLADRLHNMRTLESLSESKRHRISQETLEIYAPLANRLGVYSLKSELEDLCLRQLKPEIYAEIKAKVSTKKAEREQYINEVIKILELELKKYGFTDVKIYGRPKHFFSIYKKMVDRKLVFEDIHDLFAFRILVNSVKDCYEALGIVHSIWKPMPGRFKDYIAMPKANLYQSLHTTVIRPRGEPAEIQIRTHEMHRICENGIAAHWAYKERPDRDLSKTDLKSFGWLRQFMEWQSEIKDPEEFLEAVKVDLFDDEIFVFTPKGDVIQLPYGSTALDFAFAVHTDIGLHTVNVKVDGKITPLRNKLKSGNIIEITTSPRQRPNKDWLNYVKTSKARNKIRAHLRLEQREESKRIGRELLSNELAKVKIDLDHISAADEKKLIKSTKENSLEDIYVGVGYGHINPNEVVERVFSQIDEADGQDRANKISNNPDHANKLQKRAVSGVLVSGMDHILVSFAGCCNPLPGEEIIGFITRGRGVTIHRSSCARALDLDPARRIEVDWSNSPKDLGKHSAYLKVICQDKPGVLADVTSIISKFGANIQRAQIKISSDHTGVLDFAISVNSLDQLNAIIRKIEALADVIVVERKEVQRLSPKI